MRPLFANVGMEQNAMKALDAANIPVTEKTLALVDEMMRQGMPVNKDNLSIVYRQMGMHQNANVADLVMLHKMNIPVNEENLSMMRMYQTNQHHLFTDMQGLSTQLADMVSELVQDQSSPVSVKFIQGILDIFQQQSKNAMTEQGQVTTPEEISGQETERAVENTKLLLQEETEFKESEFMKLLADKDTLRTPAGKELLGQNLFSMLKEQFLMKPEEVRSAEYVKDFYERLGEQVDKLERLIKSVGKENSELGKEVSTVKNNIQFMNQMNEMYHYVQLPIKMNENGANGDLYVYKRKKAKTGEDGKLTALLHLSMPTLGNMDVFLSLEKEKLSTRFCMEKEEMIDFIEAHIEQLNERLTKRGYNVQTVVTAGEKEEKTVIESVMATEPSIPIITSKSFDARC